MRQKIQVKETLDHLVHLKTPTRVGLSKGRNQQEQHIPQNTKLTTVQKSSSTNKVGIMKRTQRTSPQRAPPQQSREIFMSVLLP